MFFTMPFVSSYLSIVISSRILLKHRNFAQKDLKVYLIKADEWDEFIHHLLSSLEVENFDIAS